MDRDLTALAKLLDVLQTHLDAERILDVENDQGKVQRVDVELPQRHSGGDAMAGNSSCTASGSR